MVTDSSRPRMQRTTHTGSSPVDAFANGGDFTVGAEEELLLVDDSHQLLGVETGAGVVEIVGSVPGGLVTSELYVSEIEFATRVCRDASEVAACLRGFRAALGTAGMQAMAVGLHPTGDFGEAPLTDSPRYRAIGDSLRGLLRTPTAAFQVHVGLPDAATAITAYRGLRHHLALLRALAAGSPYWHGRDSGFASGRWAVINSYPRGGVPPVVRSWDEYLALNDAVAAAAEAPDRNHVWWDLRLRPALGTVEVRVMDALLSIETAAGLTTLVQGLARHAVEHPAPVDPPVEVLAENDFRAARDGLDARIVDAHGAMRPVRQLAVEALDFVRATGADATGTLAAVDALLDAEPEHVRQRRVHREGGMDGLLADLVSRTMAAR